MDRVAVLSWIIQYCDRFELDANRKTSDRDGSAALSTPVCVGVVLGHALVDRFPGNISEVALKSCERFGRPMLDVGHSNPGLDIMLRRVDMAITDRRVGCDGH